MNILWLSWKDIMHPDAGGAEIYSEKIAQALVAKGHTVEWISLTYKNAPKKIEKNGIIYHHTLPKWTYYLGLYHILVGWFYTFKYKNTVDCVIDEVHGPPLLTPLYVKCKNIMLIHEVAGQIWQKMVPFPLGYFGQYILDPVFLKQYKKTTIITVSESTKKDLLKFQIPSEHIHIVHNGFDLPQNSNYPKESIPTLIFLSALRPMKGFKRVYDVFQKIQQQILEIQLWVVGDDTSTYASNIKNHITKNAAVKFFGSVSEETKFELLQRAHILVHGSYKEGWGRVVVEANSVGTPSVVFDAPGLRDSVLHQKTGYIAIDTNEFVASTIKLIRNKELYDEFAKNAQDWSSNFTWEKSIQDALKIIEE